MNIYQKRHAVLARHIGKRIAPAQLKAEILQSFHGTNPSSVNPADCFYTSSKAAGCTCPECTKLGGFAVNGQGIVDMGLSGWGKISSSYTPTGNIRSSGGAPPAFQANMSDPLAGFAWGSLYSQYDRRCHRFDPQSQHLRGPYAGAARDRDLYYALLSSAENGFSTLTVEWYEALLYWKLYSQPAALSNLTRWLPSFNQSALRGFLAAAPATLPRSVPDIITLVNLVGSYQLPGAKTQTALPVRTTLLHILYPNVVPIFDKKVLLAVGVWHKGANQNMAVLHKYIPYAWILANKHAQQHTAFTETAIRLTDMALWVTRA
jgi:hypothetical protein